MGDTLEETKVILITNSNIVSKYILLNVEFSTRIGIPRSVINLYFKPQE